MKLRDLRLNEHRYAVVIREASGLLMTMWIKRDPKGDVYVMMPRGRDEWNPHASYHHCGTFHHKSYDRAMGSSKRQPINGFKGCEPLGMFAGHNPKSVGAVCEPTKFSGVLEVPAGILGPRDGFVAVDLVEPGCEPIDLSPMP